MTRDTSLSFREAAYAQQTGETFLVLLTINHDDLIAPIRLCNNSADIVSRGDTYLACPFYLHLPDDQVGSIPVAKLSMDNISRELTAAIRQLTSAPTITMEVVLASSADTVEASFQDFVLTEVAYNKFTIEGSLSLENYLQEPFPCGTFTSARFPGLFPQF